jgi:hypothetical protein
VSWESWPLNIVPAAQTFVAETIGPANEIVVPLITDASFDPGP